MFGDWLLSDSPHTFYLFCFFSVFASAGGPDEPGPRVLAGREDSVVVPRGSQWHHCGDGDCALSSPGEITPSSALQGETVQNYAAAEWKQSWDCSGIQVMPPYWNSATAAIIKHAPKFRIRARKALIL